MPYRSDQYLEQIDDIFILCRDQEHHRKFLEYMNTRHENMTFTEAETNDTWMLKNAHSASCVSEQGPQRCTLQHLNGALVARSASNKMNPI